MESFNHIQKRPHIAWAEETCLFSHSHFQHTRNAGETTISCICAFLRKDYISQLTALYKLLIFTFKSRNRNAAKYDERKNSAHTQTKFTLQWQISYFWMLFIKKLLLLLLLYKNGKTQTAIKWDRHHCRFCLSSRSLASSLCRRHPKIFLSIRLIFGHILSAPCLLFASFVYFQNR